MPISVINNDNWDAISGIHARVYSGVPDAPALMKERFRHARYSLCYDVGGAIVAYLLAHPWPLEAPPDRISPLPGDGDILFIHDIAVSPDFTGFSFGKKMLKHLIRDAKAEKAFRKIQVVATLGSVGFWNNQGFEKRHGISTMPSHGMELPLMALDLSSGLTDK